MTDAPWAEDAVSLVEEFRSGRRSPREEAEATLAAIDSSALNAFSFVDAEHALAAASEADVTLPFGGVPVGIKELDHRKGWPDTGASLVYRDRLAGFTSTAVGRLEGLGGAVPVGLTTASEFGGLNVSVTKLNGVTHNPWQHGKTVGGSSGGSAAAVVGGLVPLATGGDGGGSIRIPAGYTGLVGMKGTYGRIPRGPGAFFRPGTIAVGCLARSVRDAARYFDVCAGPDVHDPSSLPKVDGWERALGSHELRGLKVAIIPNLGGVTLDSGVEQHLRDAAERLAKSSGMQLVEMKIETPNLAAQWMMGNLATLLAELGPLWPRCASELTDEVAIGMRLSQSLYNLNLAAVAEQQRVHANEVMAAAFNEVDLVISATNPGPAFAAEATMSSTESNFITWAKSNGAAQVGLRGALGVARVLGGIFPRLPNAMIETVAARFPDLVNMGGLTIISNIYGNPAISIPSGFIDGLPLGMQVLGRHHCDALLFDVALAAERETPWPRIAA